MPADRLKSGRGVQNTAKGYRTGFSAGVTKLAFCLRPIVDRFHYDRMLDPAQARALLEGSREHPFQFDVPYRVLLAWSYPLGILAAHHDIAPFIANRYSTLFFFRPKANGPKDIMTPRVIPACNLDTCAKLGFLEGENFDLMAEEVDPTPVLHFLQESVLDGWYVSSNVNKYYIPGPIFRRSDFRHPLLITGCDARRSAFSAVTYTAAGEYTQVWVPPELLARAIVSRAVFERMARPDHKGSIKRLRRFRPFADRGFELDLPGIAAQMRDYLESKLPPPERNNPGGGTDEFNDAPDFVSQCAFGAATYDCYQEYFAYALATPKEFDLRVTRALFEHKAMMGMRLACLERAGLLGPGAAKEYQPVVDWARATHLAFFQRQQGKASRADAEAISLRLPEIRSREATLLWLALGRLSPPPK